MPPPDRSAPRPGVPRLSLEWHNHLPGNHFGVTMTTRSLLLRLVVIFELGVLAGLFVGCMEFLSSVSPQSPEASRALSVPGRGTGGDGRLPKDRPDLWPGQKLHRRGPFDLRNGALDNQEKSPWGRSGRGSKG